MKYPNDTGSAAKQGGFSLLELMVVVAIVAILAAIAIPNFRQHTVKSNRSAAESFMLQVANRQEQYVLNARTYATSLASLALTPPANLNGIYTFNISPTAAIPSNTNYSITAIPVGGQAKDDLTCKVIALDQTGSKGANCAVDANGNVTYNGTAMQCTASAALCW